MIEFILNQKYIRKGKLLDNGSIIIVTEAEAIKLNKEGYGIEYIRKQNISTDKAKQVELPASGNSEVQELSTSKDMQTAISKAKRKSLDINKN